MPEPGPWFAAETVARCRREKQAAPSVAFLPRIALSFLGLAAMACLVIVGFASLSQNGRVAVSVAPLPAQLESKPATDAFLVVASIDSSLEEECDDSAPL
jgi:hypothetical protein